jgi:hypothetical protein
MNTTHMGNGFREYGSGPLGHLTQALQMNIFVSPKETAIQFAFCLLVFSDVNSDVRFPAATPL